MKIIAAFFGLCEGFVVGGALVAFIIVLDIVSRLAQVTSTEDKTKIYEVTIIASVVLISLAYFFDFRLGFSNIITIVIGVIMGLFIGMLSSALAEVTNVIPIIVDRFCLRKYTKYILFSLLTGKVAGALFYWIFLN